MEAIQKSKSSPNLDEIISEETLQDEILSSILSSLSLREAVRTSVLELLKGKTDQFIQSVNSVLQQIRGRARVDEIEVWYFLRKIHSEHLDSWVHFAVASKTNRLCLYLKPPYQNLEIEPYLFPFQLLGLSSLQELDLAYCSVKPPCKFDGLTNLKILFLANVDATENDINCLLSNCSTLEKLILWDFQQLATLSISHPLSQLNLVHIMDCFHLTKIEINALNLRTLFYEGVPVDFKFRQSSQLKYANVCFFTEGNVQNLDMYLTKLAKDLPHLERLTFSIIGVLHEEVNLPEVSNSFIHLKHLEWEWNVDVKMNLLHLAILLDVAPFLENLNLQEVNLPEVSNSFIHLKHMEWEWNVDFKMNLLHLAILLDVAPFLENLNLQLFVRVVQQQFPEISELREMIPKRPHSRLKTVEISGVYFDRWQIEIVLYLLNNATELESMKIEKGYNPYVEFHDLGIENLIQEFPAKVKLVIL